MKSAHEDQPVCFDCQYNNRGFPCRGEDGVIALNKLARAYLVTSQKPIKSAEYRENEWAGDCAYELAQDHPNIALDFVLAALEHFSKDRDIAYLAAGPLEDLVTKHGPILIDRIETAARQDRRFRYLLSGIWGSDRTDPEVWKRIQKFLKNGPWLDRDPRTPQGSME